MCFCDHDAQLKLDAPIHKLASNKPSTIIAPWLRSITSRKIVFYDNFVSFWTCHSKHLCQLRYVIPNIHVTLDHFPFTLDISCHFQQHHKRPCFLLVNVARKCRSSSHIRLQPKVESIQSNVINHGSLFYFHQIIAMI